MLKSRLPTIRLMGLESTFVIVICVQLAQYNKKRNVSINRGGEGKEERKRVKLKTKKLKEDRIEE